jgi:SecD/SecF fusion protein
VAVYGVPTEGNPDAAQEEARTGRYTTIRVDVSQNPEFKALKESGDALGGLIGAAATTRPESVKEEAAFAAVLEAAEKAFQARPIPDRLETFDPTLAADTRNKALYAIFASWLAILGYLWFRFGSWTFGLSAVLCLVHDLCLTLGVIAACHYFHDTPVGRLLGIHDFKIDLTAVAALLTLIGYSVNDTIVVFDRIKEVRGKNPALTTQIINDSVNGTLSRTVLASLTVFLVVGVLYLFGGEGVHLFAFVMVVGVIVGTYSSIYVASPLLLILGEGKPRAGDRARLGQTAGATA